MAHHRGGPEMFGISMEDIMRARGDDQPPKSIIAKDIDAVRLRDTLAAYSRQEQFQPGDIIRRKGGLSGTSNIEPPTGLYIVMEVIPDMKVSRDYNQLHLFNLRLDVYLGFYDEDGDFMFAPSDSRRYEKVPEAELQAP